MSAPTLQVKLNPNLVGGIGDPRWLPWWPAWKTWNNICSGMVSQTKLKLGGRHLGDMEIQYCWICSILTSKMAAGGGGGGGGAGGVGGWGAASWNSSKDVSSQTVMQTEPKFVGRHHGLISENLQTSSAPEFTIDWTKTWWEALGWNGNSELLKTFCYYIHDGCHSSHLEDLLLLAHAPDQLMCGLLTMVCPSSVCLSVTFHIFDIFIRIISMIAAMAAILKVFIGYLLPNSKSDGAETCWKALGQHGDLELLKWFQSDIQDGHHGSHLEFLQITSALER